VADGCLQGDAAQWPLSLTLPTLSHQGRVCASLLPTRGPKRVPARDPQRTTGHPVLLPGSRHSSRDPSRARGAAASMLAAIDAQMGLQAHSLARAVNHTAVQTPVDLRWVLHLQHLQEGHAMLTLSRRLLFLAVSVAVLGGAAAAADYPSRPVRIIVAGAPGGGDDFAARLLAEHLSAQLGQPFVVENRPGAGGAIGQLAVAKAPPDGYTLLLAGGSMAGARFVNAQASYDLLKDFTPISTIETSPFSRS